MAKGDIVSDIQLIEDGEFLHIKPGANENWKVHNIYHVSNITLYFTDGEHELEFDSAEGPGVYAYFAFGCTNSVWLMVENTHGADPKLIGYDGVEIT